MSVIDEIKERLDVVEVVRARVKLKKAGSVQQGLCPFHQEKTPSFTVFPDSGRIKCFGCGWSGDVLDFVQAFDQVDLQEAMRILAQQAGVELHQSEEQKRATEARRRRESAYDAATTFFESRLAGEQGAQARAYCAGRGWSEETIRSARLGFWDGDWLALRKSLTAAGVDLADPAAQAVLKMPPGMLVYPHLRGGKTHYLSARGIEGKTHWNLPRDQAGDKHPFFNHAYRRGERVVVVEGQADAITLGQWGVSAVALAGSQEQQTKPLARLIEILATHPRVLVGLDQDAAGERGLASVAAALMEHGLSAVKIGVVRWPKKDPNDWLVMDGPTDEDVQALLNRSECWLMVALRRFEAATDSEESRAALEDAARAYGSLDAVDQVAWKKAVCTYLEIGAGELRKLLEAVDEEDLSGLQETRYEVRQGMICRVTYNERGEQYLPLCNFNARLVEDIVEDDGEETERRFVIDGALKNGDRLHSVEVDAEEFGTMKWVLGQWGARAAVAAGSMARDHLRVALLTMSEPRTRYEYAHLGWRKINGRYAYLSAGGAVGQEGVQVRLPRDLDHYQLPLRAEKPAEAMAASLRFLDTGGLQVTVPLWASMFLAPLSEVLPPSFTLWIYGTTGSLKSTATALAMCHFGQFSYNTPPASWTGTANALEKKAFLCKDAPLWIDDYTAQSTMQGMSDIKRKADQLLRDWGNRSGRSRMRADLSLRRTFVPRGMIISTAEQLPPGQSILSRLFAVEVHPQMMTRGEGSALTIAQTEEAGQYRQAMAGYLSWLAGQYEGLEARLRERHLRYVESARREGTHLRMPGNVATLFLGMEMGLAYALECGALDQAQHDELRDVGWQTLLAIGESQHQVVAEEKPVEMYITALEQMFAQGSLYLRDRVFTDNEDMWWPAHRQANAEHVGWRDTRYWYLMPKVAYNAVWRFYRAGGVVFPDSERGVRVKLREEGVSLPNDGRLTYQVSVNGSRLQVLRVVRPETDAGQDRPESE